MPVFDTPGPVQATLELNIGDVRIAASDRTDTTVEVRPSNPASERDVQAAEQTRVEYDDGRLHVRTPRPRGLGLFGKPGSVDVEIALPTGSALRVNAALGAVHATGTLGDTFIKTATGDVRLERTARLELTTASGAVVLDRATGDVHIITADGAMDLTDIEGSAVVKNSNGDSRIGWVGGDLRISNANGNIVVRSAGGDVDASTANGSVRVGQVVQGTVSVKTAAGSLHVGVATGTAAYLDLNTTFGKVRSELQASDAPQHGERNVAIKARTAFGNIDIVRAPA
ncbi:DUF4097 family beta strand repeat-containing protein [Actinoplanes sp. N902-109]|uniref:DUF4097 family beta strand repeat-containing protein n=1 Tax=Actinoplanes sp. (strain N902-109) TaxID=649831 RepID=UPI00032958A2|nr:DUF4097 family beta strand repeat-containing protein [Actinoplanes sp. N902-109]AGL17775.1 hypothetical protein L083_4265 [Actinoplanes sp. N902-109]